MDNLDDFGERQVWAGSWSFPERLIGPFTGSESEGRPSGEIIGDEIETELTCNHRLLERILGDFLSQWVADGF